MAHQVKLQQDKSMRITLRAALLSAVIATNAQADTSINLSLFVDGCMSDNRLLTLSAMRQIRELPQLTDEEISMIVGLNDYAIQKGDRLFEEYAGAINFEDDIAPILQTPDQTRTLIPPNRIAAFQNNDYMKISREFSRAVSTELDGSTNVSTLYTGYTWSEEPHPNCTNQDTSLTPMS